MARVLHGHRASCLQGSLSNGCCIVRSPRGRINYQCASIFFMAEIGQRGVSIGASIHINRTSLPIKYNILIGG